MSLVNIAEHASATVYEFLAGHGGMPNGYNTWAKGEVRRDSGGCIEWSTPNAFSELTGQQVKGAGYTLYSRLGNLIYDPDIRIVVTCEHESHGCFVTNVEVMRFAVRRVSSH